MQEPQTFKTLLAGISFFLFAVIAFGLFWLFFLGPAAPVGVGWYLFSFAAGLSMIVLPCTLPLAFVIVPLAMGKSATKGLMMALMFGTGVALMLSVYGIIAAFVGEVAIGSLGTPLEAVKNWLYFVAGLFAYLFALGEIGLIKLRMPTYTGAAPAFIQKRHDYLKALFLGLFLGNIGVGCPHPATPMILTRIASSGDVFYGWLLFFVHAAGRVLPLLLLALLAVLGVNALSWLVARKDKIERATGWGMVFVAAFILVLGLFTHDWWVNSGQHTLLEEITQEERILGAIANRLGTEPPHEHGLEEGEGLFGLPLAWGNWVLVLLWILPLWWNVIKKRKDKAAMNEEEKKIEEKIQPYRAGLAAALSVLLILAFVYVLPTRFLLQSQAHMGVSSETGMMPGMENHEGHEALLHEEADIREGLTVNLNVTPVPVVTGTSTRLDFFVNEKPGNVPVDAASLEFDQEKIMHVIGVRDDMNEFFHIHPQPTSIPGILTVGHMFRKPGTYKIWSEIKKDGMNHIFGHPQVSVSGEGARSQKEILFARNVIVGNYQVAIEIDEPFAKGEEVDLAFDIHTLVSSEVALENYLGVPMHLSIIKDDLRQFIHTHPEGGDHHGRVFIREALANGGGHNTAEGGHGIGFRVAFPEPGLYKAFAQFRPQGIGLPPDDSLTASFWIRVEEKKPFTLSGWWTNLFVSVGLIALLSWGVSRFLRVKES